MFNEAAIIYQNELDRCGFKHKLEYNPTQTSNCRKKRTRRVTWFNPPYSMNVATDVGREFLLLIDKHIKKDSKLRSALNRTTMRVSYRCMPNIGAKIAGHNMKLLRKEEEAKKGVAVIEKDGCNCLPSTVHECPTPGVCNSNGVIYQATVESIGGGVETYIGLAKNFKKRFGSHKATLKVKKDNGNTTLSTHYWDEKEAGRDPSIKWKILESGLSDFNPITSKCALCTREKFYILFKPEMASLNKRQEIFGFCRHKEAKLLEKKPPEVK